MTNKNTNTIKVISVKKKHLCIDLT